MDPTLEAERDALAAEHAELLKTHARLKQAPHDHAGHRDHIQKLHAHTARVHAFAERLHEAHGKPRPPAGGRRDAAKPKSRSPRR